MHPLQGAFWWGGRDSNPRRAAYLAAACDRVISPAPEPARPPPLTLPGGRAERQWCSCGGYGPRVHAKRLSALRRGVSQKRVRLPHRVSERDCKQSVRAWHRMSAAAGTRRSLVARASDRCTSGPAGRRRPYGDLALLIQDLSNDSFSSRPRFGADPHRPFADSV